MFIVYNIAIVSKYNINIIIFIVFVYDSKYMSIVFMQIS